MCTTNANTVMMCIYKGKLFKTSVNSLVSINYLKVNISFESKSKQLLLYYTFFTNWFDFYVSFLLSAIKKITPEY